MVGKRSFGSLGKEVALISNRSDLERFEAENTKKAHLYQEFIASSSGIDFRLIVVGGKFVAGMKRHNESDFRSNLAQGGKAEAVEIPDGYKYLAEKAAKIMGLDYAGIDILVGKDKEPILCEVNSNAFLDGIEKTTGVNVAAAYASFIKKTLGL